MTSTCHIKSSLSDSRASPLARCVEAALAGLLVDRLVLKSNNMGVGRALIDVLQELLERILVTLCLALYLPIICVAYVACEAVGRGLLLCERTEVDACAIR